MKIFTLKKTYVYYMAWFAISLFYFYQYILRVSPGIMIVELREVYKLTADEFSALGAIYLYAYSLLQVPLGFILDRVGIRRLIAFSVLICVLGTLLFAYAHNMWALQMGRFLIGVGSAPAFICALKLVSDHLPLKKQGLFMGATLAIGTIGALLAGKVLVALIDQFGWQNSLVWCAGLGGFILLFTVACVPSSQKVVISSSDYGYLREGLRQIFKQKEILLYSIIAISVYTPLCILADLWGTVFLMEKFTLSRADAAEITLYMYGGLTIGSLLLPWFSVRKGVLKEIILCCAIGLILTLLTLLYGGYLSQGQLSILLILLGFFCGAEMICFAGAAQFAPVGHSGLSLGVVNTLNMMGGAFVQQGIGCYLDAHWRGKYGAEGARLYEADELSSAFLILILIMVVCSFIVFALPKRSSIQMVTEIS